MQRQRQGAWPVLPFILPMPTAIPTVPLVPPDQDINIVYDPPSPPGPQGPPGPPGPPGPQGPPGTLANLPVTLVDQESYSASSVEYFLPVITGTVTTITLPSGTAGKIFIVKDALGICDTEPIIVTATSSTIDGEANYILNTPWASIGLIYNGVEWNVV